MMIARPPPPPLPPAPIPAPPAGPRVGVAERTATGSRPAGWWRARPGAPPRLLERPQTRAAVRADPITLVLEGAAPRGLPPGRHGGGDLIYARRAGRDAGDDR